MIKRMLVAIDGSEPAAKALDYALDIAEKYAADVLILSVIPPINSVIPRFSTASPPKSFYKLFITEIEKRLKIALSEALKKVKAEKPMLKISTALLEGRPAEKIVQVAEEKNFDIIIMGSRGLGSVKELFLGSVSDKVADTSTCPVLIVK